MMTTGGNARGRAFFKDHGWDELGTDKITTKVRSTRCLCLQSHIRSLCSTCKRCIYRSLMHDLLCLDWPHAA